MNPSMATAMNTTPNTAAVFWMKRMDDAPGRECVPGRSSSSEFPRSRKEPDVVRVAIECVPLSGLHRYR
jgi:hypothetical protein